MVLAASHELQLLLPWLTPGFMALGVMWDCSWLQGARENASFPVVHASSSP